MWWERSKVVDVYLSPSKLGVATPESETQWHATDGLDDALRQLGDCMSSCPARPCKVRFWLSAAWARPMMLDVTCGARNAAEAQALAGLAASANAGLAGPLKTWTSRWRAGQDTLLVAMPLAVWEGVRRSLASRLEGVARKDRKDQRSSPVVIGMKPWWNQALNQVLERSLRENNEMGWSIWDSDGMVFGLAKRGQIVDAGFGFLDPPTSVQSTLLRLEMGWESSAMATHVEFVPSSRASVGMAVGGCREVTNLRHNVP